MFFTDGDSQSNSPILQRILVQLHKNENYPQVRRSILNAGAKIENNDNDHSQRIRVDIVERSQIIQILQMQDVKYIDVRGKVEPRNPNAAWISQSNIDNVNSIYLHGLNGEGEVIGHVDNPINIELTPFCDEVNNVANRHHRKIVAFHGGTVNGGVPWHGSYSASILAGHTIQNNNSSSRWEFDGHAWMSKLSHANSIHFINFASDLSKAHNLMYKDGAKVISQSFGILYNNKIQDYYSSDSYRLDSFSHENEEVLIVTGVPNFGSETIQKVGVPENSKNCLAVGASGNMLEIENSFGFNGPTFDGRKKPEILAPGKIRSVGYNNFDGPDVVQYVSLGNKTSWATPVIAAYAAITRQYYREGWYPIGAKQPTFGFNPSGALLKATLLNATVDMTGVDDDGSSLDGYPTDAEGWGRLLLDNALYFQGDPHNLKVWDILNRNGLAASEKNKHSIHVTGDAVPLKITLVWTDPVPAMPHVTKALLNNLTLKVTGPDNQVYFGNDFNITAGESKPGVNPVDDLNNVEMVLLKKPSPGTYKIEIFAEPLSMSSIRQGYALVATADTEDPPIPTGKQNTLVIRAGLDKSGSSYNGPPSAPDVMNQVFELDLYIQNVSYGQTNIEPVYKTVELEKSFSTYTSINNNPLIELAQDAIGAVLENDVSIFEGDPLDPADDIDRVMIVVNEPGLDGDWATTGLWPYEFESDLKRRLSVSVTSVQGEQIEMNHAMLHQLGMVDLYAHEGEVFEVPRVEKWDIMANELNVQPLAWSKERIQWLTTHDANSVKWIPRPGPADIYEDEIPINWMSGTETDHPRAIAFGMTSGVTDIDAENLFYIIEARENTDNAFDMELPGKGVLVYYVNESIEQGEGPVFIYDRNSDRNLDDAAIQTGSIELTHGLDIEVVPSTGTEAYRIKINYDPVETENDIYISRGDPDWTSEDIWVDAIPYSPDPKDEGDFLLNNKENRIYFTLRNYEPSGDVFNVIVTARISEPYHTIGDAADFNKFIGEKYYPILKPSDFPVTDHIEYIPEWTDVDKDEPIHACIKIEIQEVPNDRNKYNNSAQQNTKIVESATDSPFEPIEYQFSVTNPYDYYQLVYFRLEGLPTGWTYKFKDSKKTLSALERYEGLLKVFPREGSPICTSHELFVTSWMPRGNTLVRYGGATLKIDLRERTVLTANSKLTHCDSLIVSDYSEISSVGRSANSTPKCFKIETEGCTDPVLAFQEILVRYEDALRNPEYRKVTTDEFGCYSDVYIATTGGDWNVTTTYEGDSCQGSTTTGRNPIVVPIPLDFPTQILASKGLWVSAHAGSTHPLGTLRSTADANIYAATDITTAITDKIDFSVTLGFAQMSGESEAHPYWWHLSPNLEMHFFRKLAMKPYTRIGPGYYMNHFKDKSMGFNVGLGARYPLSNDMRLSAGLDFHKTGFDQETSRSFIGMYLGILFK